MTTSTQPSGSGGPISPAARPNAPAGAWNSASRPPHAPGSAPRKRRFGHLVSVHPSRDTLLTAAVAVGALLVVKFVVAFVQLIGNAVAYSPTSYSSGFVNSPIGLFLGSLVLYPFFFYLAVFVALTVVFPLVRDAPLSTILGRAVAAGAVGTVVLAVVGIVTGISLAISSGDAVAVVLYVLFIPLAAGVQLTAVLVGGAVLAWLWHGHQSPEGAQEAARASSQPAGPDATAVAGAAGGPGARDAPAAAGGPDVPGASAVDAASVVGATVATESGAAVAGAPAAATAASPVGAAPDEDVSAQDAPPRPSAATAVPLPPPRADDLSRFAPPDERH